MRIVLVVSLLALFCPAVAVAQPQPAPAPATASPATKAAPRKGGDITRDEYIERAKRNAEARFDRMDINHDGVLTAEERRGARSARAKGRSSAPQ